jgi:hypothetical protein
MPIRPTKANVFGESGIREADWVDHTKPGRQIVGLPELVRIARSIGGLSVTTAWATT